MPAFAAQTDSKFFYSLFCEINLCDYETQLKTQQASKPETRATHTHNPSRAYLFACLLACSTKFTSPAKWSLAVVCQFINQRLSLVHLAEWRFGFCSCCRVLIRPLIWLPLSPISFVLRLGDRLPSVRLFWRLCGFWFQKIPFIKSKTTEIRLSVDIRPPPAPLFVSNALGHSGGQRQVCRVWTS